MFICTYLQSFCTQSTLRSSSGATYGSVLEMRETPPHLVRGLDLKKSITSMITDI
jgi:hypothetical protein